MTAMGSWMFRVGLISWISITSANCLFLLLPQGPSIILKSFSETCWWSFSMVYFNRCDFHTVFNSNENSLFCFTNVIIIIPCIRACPKIKNYTNFMFKLSFAFDVEIWTKCITSKRKFQLYFTVICFSDSITCSSSFSPWNGITIRRFLSCFSIIVWLLVAVATFSFEKLLLCTEFNCLSFICSNNWLLSN